MSDDFPFPIVNFPFINSDIPAAPAYGVYNRSYVILGLYYMHIGFPLNSNMTNGPSLSDKELYIFGLISYKNQVSDTGS